MASPPFRFKKFEIQQHGAVHPVGTDSVLLGAWAGLENAPARILDIGTGTGVIALMLAQRAADAQITAVEMHPASVSCARRNAAASPWADRLNVFETSIQDFAAADTPVFDLIVSNPPFFSETTVSPDPARRLGRHTASLTAVELIVAVQVLLAQNGRFCVILPEMEGKRLCELAALQGLYVTNIMTIRSRSDRPIERLLLCLERSPYGFERSELFIYMKNGGYALEYQELTSKFYLNF